MKKKQKYFSWLIILVVIGSLFTSSVSAEVLESSSESSERITTDGESIADVNTITDITAMTDVNITINEGLLTPMKRNPLSRGDISSALVLNSYEITKTNGVPETEFEVGDWLTVSMSLDIPYPEGTVAGDTFSVNIPNSEYFNFEMTGSLSNGSDDPIVTYEVKDGKVTFTIMPEGIDGYEGLFDVQLKIRGTAKESGDDIDGGGNGDIQLVVKPASEPKPGVNTDDPFQEDNKKLYKTGKQHNNGANIINWAARINYQDLDQLFELGNNGGKITNKTDMMVVDHLTPGTTFVANSLYVTVPVYIGTTQNEMGERQVGEGLNNAGNKQETNFANVLIHQYNLQVFELIQQGTMSYADFYKYVQEYPKNNNGVRAYGVYTHEDGDGSAQEKGTQTVLIAFGDSPGNTYKYEDLRKDFGGVNTNLNIYVAIENDESLTPDQKAYLKKIYSPEGPSNGMITAYDFAFDVEVKVPEYSDDTYENKITLVSSSGSEETTGEAEFVEHNGSANAYGLALTKKVEGTGALAVPKDFEFQIKDENGKIVAYGKTESPIEQKGQEGAKKVVFYEDAAYTIQILTYPQWKKLLTDNNKHFIYEIGATTYLADFENERTGVKTNEFYYEPNVKQKWSFVATNTELTVLPMTGSVWQGGIKMVGFLAVFLAVLYFSYGKLNKRRQEEIS